MEPPHRFNFQHTGPEDAPAVIFLHGFMGDGGDWSEITEILSASFRCIALDLPGHGRTKSPGGEEAFRMEAVAGSILSFCRSRHLETPHVVGYSMGGRLALFLAARFARFFGRFVLESASPGLASESERRARRERDAALAHRLETGDYARFLSDWYDQPLFATMRNYPERFQHLLSSRAGRDPSGYAASLRMMGTGAQPSLWDDLDHLSRCRLIVGEKDAKFRQIAGDMQARNPSVTVSVVENAGHNVHWEKPEQYARLVRDFLAE